MADSADAPSPKPQVQGAKPQVQLHTVWEPLPGPQTLYCNCPVFEVFFGGARGGGKTDAALGEFAMHAAEYGKDAIGIVFRRKRTELVEAIERSKVLYKPLGAKFHEQDKLWRFPNDARLRFAYLENDADADNYQGHNYTRVIFEEIGTFPSPKPIMKMMATLRSGAGVPVGFRATGNPGGPGHHWVKERYVDSYPTGNRITEYAFNNPFTGEEVIRDRIFIPSKVSDNKYLGAEYVANLYMSGSAELVRAWLTGDWNVIQGAYFPEFGSQHVIAPIALPPHLTRFRAMDWGSYRPFAVLWFAVSDGSVMTSTGPIPEGALIVYRELYGASSANVGLKLPPDVVGRRIKDLETGEKVAYAVADPACAASDGGPSILERMARAGAWFGRGDNKRIPGHNEVRARLVGNPDGHPMLYMFSTCTNLIRTLPQLQHDDRKPEDLNTEGEDHVYDALRYGCMSRPYIKGAPQPQVPQFMSWELPIDKIIDMAEAREARRTKI